MVQSFDPITQEVSAKEVEGTFVRESSELVHISVGNETITTTPEHPFCTIQKEFVKVTKLRAGDILCTVNGEYVVVEQIQHEILESPIKVYNFRVADNHMYYVGNNCVGVHNTKELQLQMVTAIIMVVGVPECGQMRLDKELVYISMLI